MKEAEHFKPDALKIRIKRIMLHNPDISLLELMEELDNQGLCPRKTTVANIINEFRHSLKFLQEEGYLKTD